MRITNKMMSDKYLYNLNNNLNHMTKAQNQLSTGKQFSKPSDNPLKVAKSMQIDSDLASNEQYKANIQGTTNYLDVVDTTLATLNDVLVSFEEKLVSAGNAAYGSDERNAINQELNEKVAHFAQALNTSFQGTYVFGGTRGTDKPVKTIEDANGKYTIQYANSDGTDNPISATELTQISSKYKVEVSQGVTMEYNTTAPEILNYDGGTTNNIMDLFKNILTNLDSSDPADINKLTTENLTDIQAAHNNILKSRSTVGAMQNRMDSALSKNKDEILNLKEILSSNEDVDVAETTMQYAMLQTTYIAALQTGAKVIQPTLLDYL